MMSIDIACKTRGINFFQFTKDFLEGKIRE